MKNYSFYLFLVLVTPVLLFVGCGDDDDGISYYCRNNPGDPSCPNYDPCFGIFAADSDFEIIDTLRYTDTLAGIPVTITKGGSGTFFRPNRIDPNATYAWRVGSDPRVFTDPYVNLNFGGFSGTVNVQLEVTVPANDSCLFENELVSRSNKNITFVNVLRNDYLIVGTFKGSLTEDGLPFQDDLSVTMTGWDMINTGNSFRVVNLPLPLDCRFNNDNTSQGFPTGGNYMYAVSIIQYSYPQGSDDYPPSCRARRPILLAKINPEDHDEMIIDYWFNDDNGKRLHRQFIGQRQ